MVNIFEHLNPLRHWDSVVEGFADALKELGQLHRAAPEHSLAGPGWSLLHPCLTWSICSHVTDLYIHATVYSCLLPALVLAQALVSLLALPNLNPHVSIPEEQDTSTPAALLFSRVNKLGASNSHRIYK